MKILQQNDIQLIMLPVDLYLQNRMNYELRAVRFDYSCSIFGAEHMRQVSSLETGKEKKRHCTKTETKKKKEN